MTRACRRAGRATGRTETRAAPVELRPTEEEAVLDKVVGTPLEMALRGAGVQTLAIVGVATEIGIEPTVRHAGDLGLIPVVISDACASGNTEAGTRTIETLRFLRDAFLTDLAGFQSALAAHDEITA
jgi:nicotinamidase-related amidase